MNIDLDPLEIAALRAGVERAVLAGAGDLQEALERDPGTFLHLLAAAQIGAQEADRLLHAAVASARRAGHSWDAIGAVLGVTRQGAQQRFRTPQAGAQSANRRVLTGAHSFNEMKLLDEEGRRGAHLVDFGPLYLVVEDSAEQWKHRRLFGVTPARRTRLEADGWISVGAWFPFHYFKRRLGDASVSS
jgi:hypothetical protein